MNPINDELPVVGPGLKPVLSCPEGQEILITAEFLYATDADTANNSLLFLIARQPRHGVVLRKGGIVDRFIQADVAAGIISYKHTGESTTVCVMSPVCFTLKPARGYRSGDRTHAPPRHRHLCHF